MSDFIDINFLDSFRADTSIVPEVIDRLISDLRFSHYPQDEIDEVILAMDEAITNAVQETISTLGTKYSNSQQNREITIRYTIGSAEFNATVIDHGKGLDIDKMIKKTPDQKSVAYHEQIFSYLETSTIDRLKIRINGKEVHLNGIGAGLKILLSFMDTVTIDLIDKQRIVADQVTEFTDGTILNMYRKRRFR
jgi:anti-sigma regulatory factor (Ser/Thr protein kinase)